MPGQSQSNHSDIDRNGTVSIYRSRSASSDILLPPYLVPNRKLRSVYHQTLLVLQTYVPYLASGGQSTNWNGLALRIAPVQSTLALPLRTHGTVFNRTPTKVFPPESASVHCHRANRLQDKYSTLSVFNAKMTPVQSESASKPSDYLRNYRDKYMPLCVNQTSNHSTKKGYSTLNWISFHWTQSFPSCRVAPKQCC